MWSETFNNKTLIISRPSVPQSCKVCQNLVPVLLPLGRCNAININGIN